jgi:hypothetical protein
LGKRRVGIIASIGGRGYGLALRKWSIFLPALLIIGLINGRQIGLVVINVLDGFLIVVRLFGFEEQVPDEEASGEEADQTRQANEAEPIASRHVLLGCMSASEMHA